MLLRALLQQFNTKPSKSLSQLSNIEVREGFIKNPATIVASIPDWLAPSAPKCAILFSSIVIFLTHGVCTLILGAFVALYRFGCASLSAPCSANLAARLTSLRTSVLGVSAGTRRPHHGTQNISFFLFFTTHFSFFGRTLSPFYSNFHTQTYYGLILYVFLALSLCGILASLAYLFSISSVQDSEKRSEYECGFEPFDSATRLPFDVHFYLVGILFLIFDVEIALLFPWVLGLRMTGWFGFYLMLGFIALLAIGFLYEWKRGALIWPSRQTESTYNSGYATP